MKNITLSINPIYACNFRCEFCYLTKEQLSDRTTLALDALESRLQELREEGVSIDHVDLYGGEISLLSEDYLDDVDRLLAGAGRPTINVVTNLYKIHPFFLKDHIDLSVSFDFDCRQSHEKVLANMESIDKEIAVLVLASPELMRKNVEEMVDTFNRVQNVKSVEIKPYSSNQANQLGCSDEDFEEFIKSWIECQTAKNFEFVNLNSIKHAMRGERNAFSDDHLYVTPSGKYGVLEFDGAGREFFLELESFKEYEAWKEHEKSRVGGNSYCSKCEYLGRCLTEHYREVDSVERSCNGYYKLLKWAERQEL